jgi:hypothetical protein
MPDNRYRALEHDEVRDSDVGDEQSILGGEARPLVAHQTSNPDFSQRLDASGL